MQIELLPKVEEMYDALVRRDSNYEGLFVVGVKTTGIFCRSTCPARKPKRQNVEFFRTSGDALLAGYRPCKRCRPLEPAGSTPGWLRPLVDAVDAAPIRRWRDDDLRALSIEPARIRRWFQCHHGMTFHAYVRARRLAAALGTIRHGADLLETGFDHGYESASGFRDAFQNLFGAPPGRGRETRTVSINRILTPLGVMAAAATDAHLHLLEFADRPMLETQVSRVRKLVDGQFVPGDNAILDQTRRELDEYFAGRRTEFDVPLSVGGTPFQQAAWTALQSIPYGCTRSYSEQAALMDRPSAVRAVGRANGDNRIAIIIPCHRVIAADGSLCGYGGQLWRKRALLSWERRVLDDADPGTFVDTVERDDDPTVARG